MHVIRKGQIRWLAKGDIEGQRHFIHNLRHRCINHTNTKTSYLFGPYLQHIRQQGPGLVREVIRRNCSPISIIMRSDQRVNGENEFA